MRTAIRALAITAAAALTVTGLAACSAGGSGSSGDSKTLTYWASNQGTSLQNDKEVLTPVLKKFTKETGIKVDLQVIGWNDLQTKIQTAVTSGQGPDVVNIGNTWATSLQATGAFKEFGASEMKAIGGSDKFGKVALSTGGAPGKTVTSVPLYGLAYGLYYNKQMLQDAGITPPTTWEDLVTDAKKLTTGGKYGFSLAGGSYTENAHFAFINSAQNGGEWFDKSGKPTFTSKANVDGIKRYLDLMQDAKVANPSNAQYDNATQSVTDFANKKAAFILNQNNANNTIESLGMKSDEYGVVALPAPADGKEIASFPAGINLSIFKNTKNEDGALKFVKYMTSANTQTTLDKPYSALPVLAAAADSVTDEQTKTFLDIYNNKAKPLPLVPAEDQFESTVGKAMNDMFAKIATGGTVSASDIKSALQTAQDQVSQANG
ncbi:MULTISPECIES: ABC transporter substrate-binding protein [unclassified Curtobacterium]|uniref:ABC transporter substrate-binding protein n=1 Tax=unclassified Curtobacterium TaxID=257496 RepID=UPI00188AC59E|nr:MULTISPECIES: sugar ABC transporter substrate-binding protein [unclassified Curtobacterium]MBF4591312.1 sugar ABC transporter substrate-binding protein [Curtobacterium sp. VKM Ac-1395]MCY1695988.1 sugar ABC transporter substrate-binding protein [Curtobacterium sp. SL109]